MDTEVQKIEALYNKDFSTYIQPLDELSLDTNSGKRLVKSKILAYNFDKIKATLYPVSPQPTSADALYFNNKLALIEFKCGLKPKGKGNGEYKKNCEDSARDSLMIHNYFMSLCSTKHINFSLVKTLFVVVINSSAEGKASDAYANSLAGRTDLETNFKKRLVGKFTGKNLFGDASFYSEVDVWNDVNFDIKLSKI